MMLTLFADASFCPRSGAAGWGSWAIKDGWPRGKFLGGPLRRKITSSTTAELLGLASALWLHNKAAELDDVDIFMLQCDNVTALGYILGKLPKVGVRRLKGVRQANIQHLYTTNKLCLEALDAMKVIVGDRQVHLRHVKGHNGTSDGRSWVNTQCDEKARRHMLAQRLELGQKA